MDTVPVFSTSRMKAASAWVVMAVVPGALVVNQSELKLWSLFHQVRPPDDTLRASKPFNPCKRARSDCVVFFDSRKPQEARDVALMGKVALLSVIVPFGSRLVAIRL